MSKSKDLFARPGKAAAGLWPREHSIPFTAPAEHFLKAFSKPACEWSGEEAPALAQVLHLLNNPAVVAKVKSSDSLLGHWLASGLETPVIVERMYLATLSRRPTAEELKLVNDYLAALADRAEGLHDSQHALVNSNEFLLRH